MCKIGIACDCHNTLINSNDAWVRAFIDIVGAEYKDEITLCLYGKIKMRNLAQKYNIDFSLVEELANKYEKKNNRLISALTALKDLGIPLVVVSNAPSKRVLKDMEITGIRELFSEVYTGDNGGKINKKIFDNILQQYNLDYIIFLGNEEFDDHIEHDRVISFALTSFLRERFEILKGYPLDMHGVLIQEGNS